VRAVDLTPAQARTGTYAYRAEPRRLGASSHETINLVGARITRAPVFVADPAVIRARGLRVAYNVQAPTSMASRWR